MNTKGVTSALLLLILFAGVCFAQASKSIRREDKEPRVIERLRMKETARRDLGPIVSTPGWQTESYFVVESSHINFDRLKPGRDLDARGAITIRVHSSRSWELKLVSDGPLHAIDKGEPVSESRLQIRAENRVNLRYFIRGFLL